MNVHCIDAVRQSTEELVKWNEIEEKSMLQRTKINWLKMGNDKNIYFHAYLEARGSAKYIQFPQKEDETILTEHANIEEEFMLLYSNLTGKANNSITHIDVEAIRKGKQINNEQSAMLVGQVTIAEIKEALKGIGDQKSLRMDGYGSKFFKYFLSIVKKDFVDVVRKLFNQGVILMDFNITIVTLIPKHVEAKHAKDYMHAYSWVYYCVQANLKSVDKNVG